MYKTILFTGGTRSGKSAAAERYAALCKAPVVYIATAEAGDDEMSWRIARHQARRPSAWTTIEAPRDAGAAVRSVPPGTTVLLDCLTLLVSNILLASESDPEPRIMQAVDDLLAAARERNMTLIVVTNEVGMGIVPEYPLGRRYRDLLGWAAQRIAAVADEVYLVVAGIVVELRALEARWVHSDS